MKATLYISDIHLNAGWDSTRRYPHPFEWLAPSQRDELVTFLGTIDPVYVERVVIAGDLLDTWIYPVDAAPPTVADVVAANPTVFEAINGLRRKGISVVYLPGNHDMAVTAGDLVRALPGTIPGAAPFQFLDGGVFEQAPVHSEHSHVYCMFNAPDPRAPEGKLPSGYYISRLVATRAARFGDQRQSVGEFITGLVFDDSLTDAAFDAVQDRRIGDDEQIVLGDGRYTVGAVKASFKDLWTRWQGPDGRVQAALADYRNLLGPVAERIARDPGKRVVVFGHTHKPKLEAAAGRIYANTGCWCDYKDGSGDYVEVFEDLDADQLVVRLRRWKNGAQQTVAEARTPNVVDGAGTQ